MTAAEGRRPGPVQARGVSGYTGARVNRVGLRVGTARARRAPRVSRLGAFAIQNAPKCILASSYIYIIQI